jgi:hypothetical protein
MSQREDLGFTGYELSHFKVDGWTREDIGRFILYWKHRVYETSKELGCGFNCVVLEWASEWDGLDYYDEVMRCAAHFDGVRHLHFRQGGDDRNFHGYDNYPHIESYALLFARIRELELKFCHEADQ